MTYLYLMPVKWFIFTCLLLISLPTHVGTEIHSGDQNAPEITKPTAELQENNPSGEQKQSLGDWLTPEGKLNVPEDFSGSLDPTGFKMSYGLDGAPVFLPDAMTKHRPIRRKKRRKSRRCPHF